MLRYTKYWTTFDRQEWGSLENGNKILKKKQSSISNKRKLTSVKSIHNLLLRGIVEHYETIIMV